MSQKEVQINGKGYWELEATDQNQVFNPPEDCYVWDCEGINKRIKTIFAIKTKNLISPFVMTCGSVWNYCALLSSEHEKKSRRCSDFELSRWLSKGNGFWIDERGTMKIKSDTAYGKRNNPSGEGLVSICTWDGEPMEPTAQNMGLEE